MEKRKIEDLNLLDDFLFQELISREKVGEEVCRILLQTILNQPVGKVKVVTQKAVLPVDPNLHGIRMDAYIEAVTGELGQVNNVELEPDIYDIEPNKVREQEYLPKRTRYYHAMIDSKLLDAGISYDRMKNVVIIMILPYDPFGGNRMMYTVCNRCMEDPDIPYDDGMKKIYLYTKGSVGNTSQRLREMLQYIENSVVDNVTNEELATIHEYVNEVKHDKEVGIQYMKSWEHDAMMRAEGRAEGIEEGRAEGKTYIVALIRKKCKKSLSVSEIAEILELPEHEIQIVIDRINAFPDEDDRQIAMRLLEEE